MLVQFHSVSNSVTTTFDQLKAYFSTLRSWPAWVLMCRIDHLVMETKSVDNLMTCVCSSHEACKKACCKNIYLISYIFLPLYKIKCSAHMEWQDIFSSTLVQRVWTPVGLVQPKPPMRHKPVHGCAWPKPRCIRWLCQKGHPA